ncbi:Amoebiasin-2 [Entamoeba marina]
MIFCLLTLFYSAFAVQHVLTDKDKDSVVNIKTGDTIAFHLKTNPSTGFSWDMDYNKNVLALLKDSTLQENHVPGLVGFSVIRQITFKPLVTGNVVVRFNYRRPWENKEPARSLKYTINID